ncbi:hypothetical protein EXIGLDRAFT_136962 [Exidia glandulosa HHB12029]|uniref:Uncharacterized protein n=1 Tax=Exidia glandulosa HHB12029 TaxID=1314781 RepID=A0A165G1J4_EXIGL|nr:hypothetical protein EXIGLDRAFT_136962 [Exidia glandulosa HHB12029]
MVVVDLDEIDKAEASSTAPAAAADAPPPYQLHPGAAAPFIPMRFAGNIQNAGASTSSLTSYGAGGSGSASGSGGSEAPLRHAHSFGELEFNPYIQQQTIAPDAPRNGRGHSLAASYSHPLPPVPPRAQTDPAFRHSYHTGPHPFPYHQVHLDPQLRGDPSMQHPMSPARRHSNSPHPQQPMSPQHFSPQHHLHPPSPLSPSHVPPQRPPSAQRRQSDSPRPRSVLAAPPIVDQQPPPLESMTPEARAQEEGRRYHEQCAYSSTLIVLKCPSRLCPRRAPHTTFEFPLLVVMMRS